MFHVPVLVIILTQGCFAAPLVNMNTIPRAGFSSSCRAPRSIQRMVQGSEVVVEAGVVEVSPVRNNIYAVTLQVNSVQLLFRWYFNGLIMFLHLTCIPNLIFHSVIIVI